jgi:subtilisin family serine protease
MQKDFPRRLACLIGLLFILSACAPQKTPSSVFESATDDCSANVIANRYMVRYEDGSWTVVRAKSDKDFVQGYLTRNLRRIRYAEPDYRVRAALPSSEASSSTVAVAATMPPSTTYADNWGAARVDADTLWQQNVRGQNITVAIVDSGMDLTHPQLASRVLANPGEQGLDEQGHDRATNGVDDDGNGYVDDALGYDFVRTQPLAGDYNYHGTHVAGIIAAEHADTQAGAGAHVEGIAPAAQILPLAFLDESGSGAMSDGVRAIEYAVNRGVRVINASWGGTMCSHSLRDVIASLDARGIVFVTAAGNDSADIDTYKEYPASLNLAAQITVGATGDHDYMAQYSNYGARAVHIFAPGTSIISTLPGGRMGALSGTSMATPFVAGAVALLLSAEPTATPSQIRQALYNSAIRRVDYVNASEGRMDLRTALSELRRLLQ